LVEELRDKHIEELIEEMLRRRRANLKSKETSMSTLELFIRTLNSSLALTQKPFFQFFNNWQMKEDIS